MTPSTTSRAIRHLPGLDGLRGALVLGILAYHLGHAPGMFVTVDGFFALSGFLITGLLLHRTPTSGSHLRDWWVRRVRRLLPAVTVVVAVVVVVFASTEGIARDGVATLTWWANWNQILEGMPYWSPEPSPLRHAWTLSIEEQFYVVWPVVLTATVLLARRAGRRPSAAVAGIAGLLGVSSFAWAAWLAHHGADLNRIYLGTDTRVGSVLLGCAAAAVLGPSSFVDEPPWRSPSASDCCSRSTSASPMQVGWRSARSPGSRWWWSPPAPARSPGCSRSRRCSGWACAPTASTCGPGPCRCWSSARGPTQIDRW